MVEEVVKVALCGPVPRYVYRTQARATLLPPSTTSAHHLARSIAFEIGGDVKFVF